MHSLNDEYGGYAGSAYEPYAQATFDRCMGILTMQLQARGVVANGQAPPIESEREFIICSLDLISGLAEGLGPAIEALVARSNLRNMLLQCCQVGPPGGCHSSVRLLLLIPVLLYRPMRQCLPDGLHDNVDLCLHDLLATFLLPN